MNYQALQELMEYAMTSYGMTEENSKNLSGIFADVVKEMVEESLAKQK